jgi:hypothetical protein
MWLLTMLYSFSIFFNLLEERNLERQSLYHIFLHHVKLSLPLHHRRVKSKTKMSYLELISYPPANNLVLINGNIFRCKSKHFNSQHNCSGNTTLMQNQCFWDFGNQVMTQSRQDCNFTKHSRFLGFLQSCHRHNYRS